MQLQAQKATKLMPGAAKGEFLYLLFFLYSFSRHLLETSIPKKALKLSLIKRREQKEGGKSAGKKTTIKTLQITLRTNGIAMRVATGIRILG